MKPLKLIFCSLAALFETGLAATPAPLPQEPAGPVTLPLTEITLDVEPLKAFGKEGSVDAVLAAIQRAGEPKVLILDRFSKSLPKENTVTLTNDPADQPAAEQYAELYGPKIEAQGATATFIAPYGADSASAIYRPRPVMIVARNAPRKTLLHEYLRYLIWAARHQRSPQYFERDGKTDSVDAWRRIDNNRLAKKLSIEISTFPLAQSQAERDAVWLRVSEPFVDFQAKQLDSMAQSFAEELDVSRFLIERETELGLSKNDLFLERVNYHRNLRLWSQNYSELAQHNAVQFLREEIPTGEQSRKQSEALRDKLEDILSSNLLKIARATQWHTAQRKALR